MLTLSKGLGDEGEVDGGEEDHIKLLETREDPSEAFESAGQPLHFIAFLVELAVILLRIKPVGPGWNPRNHAKIKHQLSGFISLVGLVHQHRKPFRHWPPLFQQPRPSVTHEHCLVTKRRLLPFSLRGYHMNFGVPSAA
mgnify:CR=1 FL=1